MYTLKGASIASVGICAALALGACAASTDDPTQSEVQAPAEETAQASPPAEHASDTNVGSTKQDLLIGPYGGVWATPFYGRFGYGLGYGLGYGGLGFGYGMGYPGNINGGWNYPGPF